jgi:hypothetical protein
LGHGGRAGARGHVEGGAVVKELENRRGRGGGRGGLAGGWVLELLLHEGEDGGDVVESGGKVLRVWRGVGHGGTRGFFATGGGAGFGRISGIDDEEERRSKEI